MPRDSGDSSGAAAWLVVRDPDGGESRVPLSEETITLGRRSAHAIKVSGATVSRDHARIVHEDGSWHLEDLDSTHGTHVNGGPVERHALQHGDRIRLGRGTGHELVFETRADRPTGPPDTDRPESLAVTEQNIDKLTLLLELTRALSSSLKLDEVIDEVLSGVIRLTRADRVLLLLGEEVGTLEPRAHRNFEAEDLEAGRYSRSVIEDVYRTGDPKFLVDTSEDSRFADQKSIVDMDLRTVMCVPLPLRRLRESGASGVDRASEEEGLFVSRVHTDRDDVRILGVLYADRSSPTRGFSEQDLMLVESLANHAAIAIQNARLYEDTLRRRRLEHDLDRAREIQESLLPSDFPDLPWLEVRGLNVPARGVGGDYFEVLELDDERLCFAIGDVSGKGMSAALLMATLQASFLGAVSAEDDLGAVCGHLNQFLFERARPERYATFFVARLGPGGEMRYVSAGHNPQLLLRDGEIDRLVARGRPLGLLPDQDYEVKVRQVEPGDLILCFTDGVLEAYDPAGEEFGEDRLIEAVVDGSDAPVEEIVVAARRAVELHAAGGPGLFDDLTLLVVRIR